MMADKPTGKALLRAAHTRRWQRYVLTVLACAGTALLLMPLVGHLDLANMVMVFLLLVLLVAVRWGRGCAVLAAFLSVLLFDVVFVPPRFSLAVEDAQYLLTFGVMLVTALVTAHLAAGLRESAHAARAREARTRALYEVASGLSGALTVASVSEWAQTFLMQQFGAKSAVLVTNDDVITDRVNTHELGFFIEKHLATAALQGGKTVHSTGIDKSGWASIYLPLRTAMRSRGVLAVSMPSASEKQPPVRVGAVVSAEDIGVMAALASLIAITLERLHYVAVANAAELEATDARLRGSILSAVSHDLRTPLTVLMGLADSLSLMRPPLPSAALETAQEMHAQAQRLSNHVSNLLDLARLQGGAVRLRREWHSLEELVGASIQYLGATLAQRTVVVQIPTDADWVEVDAVLVERVLVNVIENAVKFSPVGSTIRIGAAVEKSDVENGAVSVWVEDEGVGFEPAFVSRAFEAFESAGQAAGFGLGLSICSIIMRAHGGAISVDSAATAGARVVLRFARDTPPVIEGLV